MALIATMLAAGALLPIAPRARFLLIGCAVAAILVLLAVRLRAHAAARRTKRTASTYDRIERIRAARTRRPPR
ncbi:MAG TPA: hypothetical protein VHT53_04540 [Candidatus Elarobacter sp.]|nr:hypothetical protein [Candidatus Elarobacter sp.]